MMKQQTKKMLKLSKNWKENKMAIKLYNKSEKTVYEISQDVENEKINIDVIKNGSVDYYYEIEASELLKIFLNYEIKNNIS